MLSENNIKYFTRYKHWPREFPSYYFDKIESPKKKEGSETRETVKRQFASRYRYHRGSDKNSVVLLHFIRAPLNMILSGYNYHKLCPKIEKSWIHRPIFDRKSNQLLINYIRNDFLKNKIGNYSLCQFYNLNQSVVNLVDKLYYEFLRVKYYFFDDINIVYKLLSNIDFGYNFRMENYTATSDDFDKFAHFLVINVLNFKFDLKNSIKDRADYNRLINLLRQNDVNRMQLLMQNSNNESDIKNIDKLHVTRSLYNKTYQTDLLLKYQYKLDNGNVVNVCKQIKQMTLELDYLWEWNQYC